MKTDQIISLISTIREKANRFIVQEMTSRGITGLVPSHGNILVFLFKNTTLTMKDLASMIGKDKSTITALVDKLVALGYVEKKKDEFDNRVVLVNLTEKGEALKPSFAEISNSLLSNVYDGISEEEKVQLVAILSKIENNL
jgi:MarR family transcriptional regulator, organic hydroperoxide resistance regulator